ncbi:MAG: hypothetical protein RLZZ528_163 [Pseudomonadota bacterium]
MKIASFNVENLFDRARAFNDGAAGTHSDVLDAHAELNKLFDLDAYDEGVKARMLVLLGQLGLLRSDEGLDRDAPLRDFVRLRKTRGQLLRRPRDRALPVEVAAGGRGDWVGWAELKTEPVDEIAMENTARVILDVGAEVLAVVEAESRPVLKKFHEILSERLGAPVRYAHIMVIDGNDDRGIDVGLATAPGFPIGAVRSHVDVLMPSGEPVFSRDCPVYEVTTPSGVLLHVLPNHFKSKFNDNKDKRRAQATETAAIYRRLRDAGHENVVILGDLNDTPDSAELQPLIGGTDLRDVSEHAGFTEFQYRAATGGRGIGTYGTGRDDQKIDYILLSPALFARVIRGGIFRKGARTGSDRWDMYPSVTSEVHAASDHHAIWAEIDI